MEPSEFRDTSSTSSLERVRIYSELQSRTASRTGHHLTTGGKSMREFDRRLRYVSCEHSESRGGRFLMKLPVRMRPIIL